MKSIAVAQLGARMHYAVPQILQMSGALNTFYTDMYFKKKDRFLVNIVKLLRPGMDPGKLYLRRNSFIPESKVVRFPILGLQYSAALKKADTPEKRVKLYNKIGSQFCKKVVAQLNKEANTIYSYNTASLEIFEYAKKNGAELILEQTIAPFYEEQKLMEEECDTFSSWQNHQAGNPYKMNSSFSEYIEREQKEWYLADHILTGSSYVKKSIKLRNDDLSKTKVVPYGVDRPIKDSSFIRRKKEKLNVLTIGIGLRKGTPYVLEAASRLKHDFNFRLVGNSGDLNERFRAQLLLHTEWQGTLSRSQVWEQYRWADVFLLPSICEGSATVIYEALSCGLPIITTPNSGSVVNDMVEGRIIRIRSVDQIVEALATVRENLEQFSVNALNTSEQYSVAAYSQRLIQAINTPAH